jgi:hypothetical protein
VDAGVNVTIEMWENLHFEVKVIAFIIGFRYSSIVIYPYADIQNISFEVVSINLFEVKTVGIDIFV